jgi:hypothetical protein
MTQQELDHAVAKATGEDLYEIQRCGFSLADPTLVNFDPEPNCRPPQFIDWDELEARQIEDCLWRPHHGLCAA